MIGVIGVIGVLGSLESLNSLSSLFALFALSSRVSFLIPEPSDHSPSELEGVPEGWGRLLNKATGNIFVTRGFSL